MFDQLKNMLGGLLGGADVDPQALSQAATDHIQNMDAGQLGSHLDAAAQNLQQNGQGDLAQQLMDIKSQAMSDPAGAKDAAIALLQNNARIIENFTPEFAKGILNRLGL